MDVFKAINERRAYRSLSSIKITDDLIRDLAGCAQLFCSCFNNQPWRFVFVYAPDQLAKMHETLSKGNEWARMASLIIVIFSKPDLDCVIKDRKYYLFDTGMATAAMILRATELGLVAHPIAGFSPKKVKDILDIPEEMEIITLVNIGKHDDQINPSLSEQQIQAEKNRPERLPLAEFVFINKYTRPDQTDTPNISAR